MAKIKVNKEEAFQVPVSRFCVAATSEGYTLNFSADGVHFTPHTEGTLANKDQVVVGAAQGMFFKLAGNVDDDVVVTY